NITEVSTDEVTQPNGAKDKVVTEDIESKVVYEKDDSREKDSENITTPGQKGSKVTTTTYTVNENTGAVEEHVGEPVITPATNTVVKVAAKDKVTYKKQGDNVVKTTTVYTVNPENGNITEVSTDEVTQPNGAKNKVVTEDIEPKVVYEKDDSREKDSENITTPGQKGSKVTTTTYTVNENTGAVEEHVGEPVITPATNTVVKVAAKDKVTYKKQGDNVVKTTTVYTVNPENGNITEVSTDEVTQPNGAKDKVVTEDIEPKVVYEKDDSREKDSENITTPGQKGSKVTTTTYTVNENTGAVEEHVGEPVITPATNTVVKVAAKDKVTYKKQGDNVVKTTTVYTVNPENGNITEVSTDEVTQPNGAKDKVVTEDIESKVVYEKDDSREKDSENITTPGQKGSKVTTTTYTVNENTGAVEEHVGEPVITPATNTVVKVAAKDKVTYKKQGDNVVKTTTVYTVNPENGNITEVSTDEVTQSNGAKDNAVTPAAKTKVVNPEKLTDAEKKEIEDKVKAANPGAEVVVDDKGKAAVVKDGNVSVIPSTDLVKVEGDATKPNGGNDANTPAAKTVVADKESLTPEEKAAVKKAVEAVNSGSTVVVDDKGNATVTKADGTVLNIRALDLVIPVGKLADEVKNAKVKTPATRTLVGNKEELKDFEKEAVKKAIEAVNPGATVVVDDKGNATVTLPDGSTATISKEQLVKDKEAVSKSKHGGDNLDIDLSKVEVADLANITPEEKAKFQFKVLGAITNVEEFDLDAYIKSTDKDGNTVYTSKDGKVKITIDKDGNATVEKDGKKEVAVNIDKAGNVTIVTKEGQVLAIPRDDAFKQRPYVPSNGGGNNGATNTAAKVDKAKLEGAIHQLDELIIKESAKLDAETAKEANDLLADAKKVFANADASQAEVDAMVKRLEEFKLNQALVATDDQAANNAINASNGETSEDVTDAKLAANVSKRNNQKELPNTGTGEEFVIFGAAAASILAGLGVAIPGKKKEDE
ncbi:G5 domain-containing protein, partial [uncultured Granulicatella sp.]|uniref:G5 domain-containing protein n=1 Tax=uncultured Granulicatella sp. TaxID=316089 RepID=UPI0028D1E8AD